MSTPTLFNHADPELPRIATIGDVQFNGLSDYPGRCLGITSPNDVIQLSPTIQHGWGWIMDHYRRVGLTHTKQVVWDERFEVARDYTNHDLSVFIYGREAAAVRLDERWLTAVAAMNSKNRFVQLCADLSIPTPSTSLFRGAAEVNYTGSYPVYLKAATSVSGLGVVRCCNDAELRMNLALISGGELQIQQEVDAIGGFLNLTYEVRAGLPCRLAATRQLLKGFAHNGNVYPTGLNDPWGMTDILAQHMVNNHGMRGVFGFDVAMTPQGPLAIECNPRYNGSVYPSIVAHKLGVNEWKATNFTTSFKSLDQVNLGSLEFNSATGVGVVIVNWGCINQGKLGVLLAGDSHQQEELEREVKLVL